MLALLSEDDTQAFAALYSRYRHEIYRYLLTLVKVPELAEDLVQDVFIRIWNVRDRLSIRQQFRSYLFRVCHNCAIDMNKQIAASRQLTDQLLLHYQPAPVPDIFSQEELQQFDALIGEALNALSPQRRRIYELCKKEKLSYEQAAAVLGISPQTVKTHITQTLSFLRTYIQKRANLSILVLLVQKIF